MNKIAIELNDIEMTQLKIQALNTNQSIDELATELVTRVLNSLMDTLIDQVEQGRNITLN